MIDVEELHYSYPRAPDETLAGLSFQAREGEILGFLGPSGAGKSTTQKVLIRLLRDYRGRASVMGRELRDWDHDYYQSVGVCFELPNHYQRLTALENLQHFGALYDADIVSPLEALRWVALEDAAQKPVSTLSKGMKIRLNVARSILHRPRLLFLDEPTGGLDPVNARVIKELVRRLRDEGTTVFLTTHDMTLADQLCDRVAFLARGRIAALDTSDALKKRHGRREVRVDYRSDAGELTSKTFPLDGIGDRAEFISLLREAPIESIHSQETTLEQVFIEVTGEELRA